MTRPLSPPFRALLGRPVVARDGRRIGQVRGVVVDDVTGSPEWLVVSTGILGARERWVPIHASAVTSAHTSATGPLTVPLDLETVLEAPRLGRVRAGLSVSQEEALLVHYGMDADPAPGEEIVSRLDLPPVPVPREWLEGLAR